MGDFWRPLGDETRSWLDFLSTGQGGDVHATPEQAMLISRPPMPSSARSATGQAVRMDQGVARMERSAIRGGLDASPPPPDFAALHPG